MLIQPIYNYTQQSRLQDPIPGYRIKTLKSNYTVVTQA